MRSAQEHLYEQLAQELAKAINTGSLRSGTRLPSVRVLAERRGVSIAVTQKLLGHSSPTLTAKHYVRLDVEDIREAIETTPPLSGPRAPRLVRDDALEETA